MTTAAVDVATTDDEPEFERFWQPDPRSATQLRRARRKQRRARRSPRHRFVLRALAVAAFLLMFLVGWSYAHASPRPAPTRGPSAAWNGSATTAATAS